MKESYTLKLSSLVSKSILRASSHKINIQQSKNHKGEMYKMIVINRENARIKGISFNLEYYKYFINYSYNKYLKSRFYLRYAVMLEACRFY